MKFCENCNVATEDEYCPLCGTKRLRQIEADDFCLLTQLKSGQSQELLNLLEANGVPFSKMPYGSGVESNFGLPLADFRIYVPYSSFERARSILNKIEAEQTDNLRKYLLKNVDKLNISLKLEKKLKRKLKLSDSQDIFSYCINLIEIAPKIVDGGQMTDISNGHYLFCYAQSNTLSINSATLEILSLTKN